MKIKKIIIVHWLLLLAVNLAGQSINGVVVDENKQAVRDAYIVNVSKGSHTHSNHMGKFTLNNVKQQDSVLVTRLGYKREAFYVTDLHTEHNITLKESAYDLNEVVISPEMDAMNLFTEVVLHANPVNSSQEILQQVPGLLIGQHAGGGKAEQIFLRGFDIDHGTDVNIEVDGLPVNMVSHAHGQGYADLHFVIPEVVEQVGFGKGCYYSDKGNFTTGGYVDFKTKDRLSQSLISVEGGQFNTQRLLGAFNLVSKKDYAAYIASEYIITDGPFESPQNFNRMNILGKFTGNVSGNSKISVLASYFKSSWDASGQVPQRAIDSEAIDRFGAIDDAEGGFTNRSNIMLKYDTYFSDKSSISNQVYFSHYNFDLYSNFTFYLNDPVNGDQIKQYESRDIFGVHSKYMNEFKINNISGNYQLGFMMRNDQSKGNELSHTINRKQVISALKKGDINETNLGAYINYNFEIGNFTINPGLRADLFKFIYSDKLALQYDNQSVIKVGISPKFNLLYNGFDNMQLYLKSGKGFHSNDTRVVVEQDGKKILPATYGSDLGFIWKPFSNVVVNTSLWYLFLEQEFVYVGDEAVVELSGKTERKGIDCGVRIQTRKWFFINLDANYAIPRALNEPGGKDYLPLAPIFTMVGGVNLINLKGFYGGINGRYMHDRPANEDNSMVAKGYTVVDANCGYQWHKFDVEIQIQNLFNTEWNETQFATESRLYNELESVEEIHFTPGTPFFIKGKVGYRF